MTQENTPASLALVLDDERYVDLAGVLDPAPRDLQDLIERGPDALAEVRAIADRPDLDRLAKPLGDASYASAVLRPPAIYAVGLNYRAHADELNIVSSSAPTVFALWPNSLTGNRQITRWPESLTNEVDYEVELAVVLGRDVKDVSASDALESVFGYTIINDITARNVQFAEQQWSRCKSFDGFTPCGPWVVTADEIGDPQDLRISTKVDGKIVQDGHTSTMVRTCAQLISYLSRSATLKAGTVISTGTTSGAGYSRDPQIFLKDGSVVECRIEKIGTLTTYTRVLP